MVHRHAQKKRAPKKFTERELGCWVDGSLRRDEWLDQVRKVLQDVGTERALRASRDLADCRPQELKEAATEAVRALNDVTEEGLRWAVFMNGLVLVHEVDLK